MTPEQNIEQIINFPKIMNRRFIKRRIKAHLARIARGRAEQSKLRNAKETHLVVIKELQSLLECTK